MHWTMGGLLSTRVSLCKYKVSADMIPLALLTVGHFAWGEVFHVYACISSGHLPAEGLQDRVSWVETATKLVTSLENIYGVTQYKYYTQPGASPSPHTEQRLHPGTLCLHPPPLRTQPGVLGNWINLEFTARSLDHWLQTSYCSPFSHIAHQRQRRGQCLLTSLGAFCN